MKNKKMKSTVSGRSACARVARLVECLESRVLFSTHIYTVTNTNDSGTGSLRDAINHANLLKGAETIDFAIASGAKTIIPKSALPTITTPVVINATTQPGYSGTPLIELDGALAGNANGLTITKGNTTIKGMVINRFHGNGIQGKVDGGNTIQGDYIGTDVSGSIMEPNTGEGILLAGGHNTIGGTTAAARNVISGNGKMGIFIEGPGSGYNIVQGNYVGINAAGTAALGNVTNGLDIQDESYNTIGGTTPGAGNVISGNLLDGIILFGVADHNTIEGNLVGTDATGTYAIGNKTYGMEIQTSYNTIGGNTPAARNVVSASGLVGIICWGWHSLSIDNTVIGNYVGTDITGTKALGNWEGVSFSDFATDNTLGGTIAADRNIISGNTHAGLGIYNTSTNNIVEGNYIGTDVTGTLAVPNAEGVGIFTSSINNIIGGLTLGAGNIISGNNSDGIDIGANDTTVEGNVLGLTGTSNATPPNKGADLLQIGSSGNTILGNL